MAANPDASPEHPVPFGEPEGGRWLIGILALGLGLGTVAGLNVLSLANPEFAAGPGRVLVDFRIGADDAGPNFFSVQGFMWIAFSVGLGELLHRHRRVTREEAEIKVGYLPEDERTLLTRQQLPAIYKKVRLGDRRLFLPRLIHRIVMQFQKSNSVEQANNLMNSSLELFLHEIDLRYTLVRYLNWIIPTLGFLGTVIGISAALGHAGSADPTSEGLLTETTLKLGVAFYTTGVALAMSAVLMLALSVVQAAEERVLNHCGQYCLENLINRLMEEKS